MNINGTYLRNSLFFLLFFGVGVVPNASSQSEGQPKCLERLARAVDNQKKVQKRLNKCKNVCNKNKLQKDCDQYWDDQLKALQRAKHYPAGIDESGSTLNVNPGGTFIVKFRWDQPAPEPGNTEQSWMVLFDIKDTDGNGLANWWDEWDYLSNNDIMFHRTRLDTYSSDEGEVYFQNEQNGTIYLTGKWISVKIHTQEKNEISEDKTYKLHVIERNTDDKPHVVFPEVVLTIEPHPKYNMPEQKVCDKKLEKLERGEELKKMINFDSCRSTCLKKMIKANGRKAEDTYKDLCQNKYDKADFKGYLKAQVDKWYDMERQWIDSYIENDKCTTSGCPELSNEIECRMQKYEKWINDEIKTLPNQLLELMTRDSIVKYECSRGIF